MGRAAQARDPRASIAVTGGTLSTTDVWLSSSGSRFPAELVRFVQIRERFVKIPGQAPMRWHIRDVQPGRSFVIDMPLDQAVLSFEWQFDAVADRRTRITQRIVLSGDNATAYAKQVQETFDATLGDGMTRIADAMVRAERSTEANGEHN